MTDSKPIPPSAGRRPWRKRLAREIRVATRISVLGAGNAVRGDDAVGLAVVDDIQSMLSRLRLSVRPAQILKTFDVPENYTGEIRRFAPDLVLLVDAALGGRKPGDVFFVDPALIAEEDISTHRIPLSAFARYVEEELGSRIVIVGVQPERLDPLVPLSRKARRAARKVALAILKGLEEKPTG